MNKLLDKLFKTDVLIKFKNQISNYFVNQQFLQRIVAINRFLNFQNDSANTVKKIIET